MHLLKVIVGAKLGSIELIMMAIIEEQAQLLQKPDTRAPRQSGYQTRTYNMARFGPRPAKSLLNILAAKQSYRGKSR